MSEKKKIIKTDWSSNFTLVGRPVVTDYTYKIDERSTKSDWVYNSLNLGVDCGEKYGTVYCEAIGGYSENNANVIYAHGKKEDDSDDFKKQIVVAWEDRFNEAVLSELGELSFITVGLEKTDKDKTFYKKFLSMYDAIPYIKEHLTADMVVNVKGNLTYSEYQGNVQVRKTINSIVLSKVEEPADFTARFTQSVLIDSDSASLKNVDTEKGVMYLDTVVLDYLKEKDGVEIRGQYPYRKQFEFAMDLTNQTACTAIMNKLFKVKRGTYTQITFEGNFIEGGAVVTATLDDIPDDIRELVEWGVYTEEEALARCSSNGNRERRMVLTKPYIKLVGDDKIPVVQRFEDKYTEEDLILDIVKEDEVPFDVDNSNVASSSEVSGMDWLNSL